LICITLFLVVLTLGVVGSFVIQQGRPLHPILRAAAEADLEEHRKQELDDEAGRWAAWMVTDPACDKAFKQMEVEHGGGWWAKPEDELGPLTVKFMELYEQYGGKS
jgi:hypothetical protein